MKKAYVVMHVGWEYNDEYYYRAQERGGIPKDVFTSSDAADAECDRLNLEAARKMLASKWGNLGDYLGEDWTEDVEVPSQGWTDGAILEWMKEHEVHFFEVVEVNNHG
jgi:hypothetical protein